MQEERKVYKKWTDEEDEYLINNWGVLEMQTLMKNLDRTFNAINKRAKTHKLGSATKTNYFTRTEIAKMLGVDYYTLDKLGLKFKKRAFRVRKTNIITQENLFKWLKKNPDKYYAKNIPEYALGIEPEWLVKKRKYESNYRLRRRWSEVEDFNLKSLVKAKIPYDQIAIELNRNVNSIRKRIYVLGLVPRKYKTFRWTCEEKEKLDFLINETIMSIPEMADEIMRSEGSIKSFIHKNYDLPLGEMRVNRLKTLMKKQEEENIKQYNIFKEIDEGCKNE